MQTSRRELRKAVNVERKRTRRGPSKSRTLVRRPVTWVAKLKRCECATVSTDLSSFNCLIKALNYLSKSLS